VYPFKEQELFLVLCRCQLRFPSTNIKISFQAVIEATETAQTEPTTQSVSPPAVPSKPLQPLRISIPPPQEIIQTFSSPCPSPTGTIR
jgi:forkhead box protein K